MKSSVLHMLKLPFGSALLLWTALALAQANLGELIDAGARKVSAEEFQRDLVGRPIVGPLSSVTEIEVVYTTNGRVVGVGSARGMTQTPFRDNMGSIDGLWTVGDRESICATMNVGTFPLSKRCQFWFRVGETYFISDSDSDRSTRVLRRTLKR